jgi:hypothetical protein
MTSTALSSTIAIEEMQVGSRYLNVRPGCEHGWTVASVERHASDLQVLRGGEWVAPTLVTVTYHNDRSVTHEVGTDLAIDCIA